MVVCDFFLSLDLHAMLHNDANIIMSERSLVNINLCQVLIMDLFTFCRLQTIYMLHSCIIWSYDSFTTSSQTSSTPSNSIQHSIVIVCNSRLYSNPIDRKEIPLVFNDSLPDLYKYVTRLIDLQQILAITSYIHTETHTHMLLYMRFASSGPHKAHRASDFFCLFARSHSVRFVA